MAHGERAKRLGNNANREYWSRRYGKCNGMSRPIGTHHDPLSAKRITNRAERRNARRDMRSDGNEH